MKQKPKIKGLLILLTISATILLSAFFIYKFAIFYNKTKEAEIYQTLNKIYQEAIIVDQLHTNGLHGDSDNKGSYKILSEKVGFDVYNIPKKNKYSLSKDYKSGEIMVMYSNEEKYQYPKKQNQENEINPTNKDNYNNEDLYTFDVRNGKVVIAGFSKFAEEVLTSESNIYIPESYNGAPVREIADNAFHNKNITGTVTIPESVSKIGRNSFTNNGVKKNSNNIQKPYSGTWKLDKNKWIKVE